MKKIITIIIVAICSLPLFATTVIVAPNGDYTTIQAAVNGVSSGDTIWVAPNAYYESIEINTSGITLRSNNPEQCIISSPNESHCIEINSPIDKIEGFTIKNATNSALVIYNQLSELNNCIFENNESTALYRGSAITSEKPFDDLTDCIFRNNTGVHTVLISCDYPLGSNPTVYENITNNVFINNTNTASYPVNGKDLSLLNSSDNYHGIIDRNTFKGDTGGIFIKADLVGNADLLISNCIFDETEIVDDDILNPDDVSISYSCFSGNGYQNDYTWLAGNMTNTDPDVDSSGELIWDEDDKSPCIDTGDPSITDPDGTPSDMGAIRAIDHRIDEVELPSPATDDGWKWLSFPALDVVLDEADIAENVLDDILDPTILDRVLAEDYTIYYDEQWWNTGQQFKRTEGFKFKMNAAATLEISGFKLTDNATVFLAGNQRDNWLGYWLEETQHVSDAFSDYWDGSNITSIQHQYWSASYFWGQWWYQVYSGREPTLSYGDMVIVKCDDDIDYFSWNNDTPPEERTIYSETEYFSFEEQQNYTPIYIELDENELPQEVGAFVNGVCIGAKVVEDTLCQINAYTSATQAGEIEFQFYYGTRALVELVTDYRCIDPYRPEQIREQIDTSQPANAWLVSFKDGFSVSPSPAEIRVSNYPNPFNPTTTISYSLPQKTDMLTLKIYNIKGQKVKTLLEGEHDAGTYQAIWSGKDNNGRQAASGIYFYKLSTPENILMKKMLLLK